MTAAGIACDLHARNVDPVLAENATDDTDDAGTIVVAEEREVLRQREVDVEVINLNELLDELRPRKRAADRQLVTVRQRAPNRDEVAKVGAVVAGRQADFDATILREQRRVDVSD